MVNRPVKRCVIVSCRYVYSWPAEGRWPLSRIPSDSWHTGALEPLTCVDSIGAPAALAEMNPNQPDTVGDRLTGNRAGTSRAHLGTRNLTQKILRGW
jgi:hypothetical protein